MWPSRPLWLLLSHTLIDSVCCSDNQLVADTTKRTFIMHHSLCWIRCLFAHHVLFLLFWFSNSEHDLHDETFWSPLISAWFGFTSQTTLCFIGWHEIVSLNALCCLLRTNLDAQFVFFSFFCKLDLHLNFHFQCHLSRWISKSFSILIEKPCELHCPPSD